VRRVLLLSVEVLPLSLGHRLTCDIIIYRALLRFESYCSVELGLLIHTERWSFSAAALGYSLGCFRHNCFPYGIVVVRSSLCSHPRTRPASSEHVSKSPTAADFPPLLVRGPRVRRQAVGPSSQAQSGKSAVRRSSRMQLARDGVAGWDRHPTAG
jgi:hypothetical protein